LIEDILGNVRLFEEHLRDSPQDIHFQWDEDLETGLQRLDDTPPDVVVLDLGLPDSEGPETVRSVATAAPAVPIVVLTGQKTLEVALRTQQAGASEYLQKGEITPALVGRTLRWAVREGRMLDELRQRDAWLRSLTESVSAGMFRAGPTGRIRHANEALLRMLRIEEEEELIGRDLTTLSADPTQQGRMLAEEGIEEVEVTLRRREGTELVGLLSAEAVYSADGEVLHYDGVIVDITERKREEARREQVIERVTDAIVEVDANWRFTLVNDQAEDLYDMTEEDLLGKDFWDVFESALGTRFEETYRRVMETREPDSLVEQFPRLDGWFDIQVYPNEDGGLAFYFEDVTERKERERRLNAVFNNTYQFTGLMEPDGTRHHGPERGRTGVARRAGPLCDALPQPANTGCPQMAGQTATDPCAGGQRGVRVDLRPER